MTGILSLGAAALAAIAAVVANQDLDGDIVPFFVGLTVAAGIQALAVRGGPVIGGRRIVVWVVAGAWAVAAAWIGVLLLMYQAMCACSFPPRPPEETYLGLTATIYHLLGLYGGLALVVSEAVLAARRGWALAA